MGLAFISPSRQRLSGMGPIYGMGVVEADVWTSGRAVRVLPKQSGLGGGWPSGTLTWNARKVICQNWDPDHHYNKSV